MDDDIGAYYERKRRERDEAQAKLDEARKRGAPLEEINRLERKVLWAGYTGD